MATQLTSDMQVVGTPLFTSGGDSTQQHMLGARIRTTDGRTFRYVRASAATVAGQLYQSPAEKTNHQNLTPSAAAIGDTSITVTLGATAADANEYENGYALITVTPGQGYAYQVKSNPSAAASGSLTLQLKDAIEVALTTSSRVDLVRNPYASVIVSPTTRNGGVIGVSPDIISAGNYGWLQTGGVTCVLADGAVSVGQLVCASTGVAGSVRNMQTTADVVVGVAVTGIADTEYGAVSLTLD